MAVAYQQYQTVCQPNAWTAICEYRETRKSLFVQCPQVALAVASGSVNIPGNVATAVLNADPLRKSVVLCVTAVNRNTYVWIDNTLSGNKAKALSNSTGNNIWDLQASEDGPYSAFVQSAWWGIDPDGLGGFINFLTSSYQCRAIILATAQAQAVSGGPYGNAPPGNWLSSDLSAGPANFRLQEALDGEQVTRQWFAWPIGSIPVSVTTSEAWDVVVPPVPQKMFGVGVPRLSPGANSALDSLIAKMSMYDEEQ